MNALVSMHGIWMLVFVPIGAVVAWRWSGPKMTRAGLWVLVLSVCCLLTWFAISVVNGTEMTETIYDRVMHSIGIIVGAIGYPVMQFIAGLLVFLNWPSSWKFRGPNQ